MYKLMFYINELNKYKINDLSDRNIFCSEQNLHSIRHYGFCDVYNSNWYPGFQAVKLFIGTRSIIFYFKKEVNNENEIY
jgi:hypothetical protein